MIQGVVNSQREAIIDLRVKGTNGLEFVVDAAIDTGFNAFLTLPPALVSILALPILSTGTSYLADGSSCVYGVADVTIEWDGIERVVSAYAVGNGALIGTKLLSGHELRMQLIPNGLVEIQPIP